MSEDIECAEGEEAAKRFVRLVKKATSVPKAEIDQRAKEWHEARESDKRDDSEK
jgi:hypothetical protein